VTRSLAAVVLASWGVALFGGTALSSPAALPGAAVLSSRATISSRATVSRGAALYGPPLQTRLRVSGQQFVTADGRPFEWRGITAFRLLEYVAHGREQDADRFLAWAHGKGLTVARVFAMGRNVLDLSPADGRAALPRLLDIAARHRMILEVVALTDTRDVPVDRDEHLTALGRIIDERGNAVLEVANEPVHPTQAADVQKFEVLARLRARVPPTVPVALGSIERGDGFGAGDYVTWHVPRRTSHEGWGHVLEIAEGVAIAAQFKKPLVSDEPIGAGPRFEPGRRDDSASRFRAAALLTRLAGLGATFHYEGGLQARIPAGRELECFNAWNDAWSLLPAGLERAGTFRRAGDPGAAVASFAEPRARGVFERQTGNGVRVRVLDPRPGFSAARAAGWRVTRTVRRPGAWLISARRE
jgi:hypothetical protein